MNAFKRIGMVSLIVWAMARCCAGQLYGVLGGVGQALTYQSLQVHTITIISAGSASAMNPLHWSAPPVINDGTAFSSVPVLVTNGAPAGCWCVDNVYVTNSLSGFTTFAGWCGNMKTPAFSPGTGSNYLVQAGQPAFVGLSFSNSLANLLVFYAPTNAGVSTEWTTNPTAWLYWAPQPGISNVLVASNAWPSSVIGQPTFELSTNVNWVWFNGVSAPGGEGIFSLRLTR